MIGFRDEEPTFAQAAQAAAEHLAGVDKKNRCRACTRTATHCDVVGSWCFGRTARASVNNPELRAELQEQLERVIAMHDWFPGGEARTAYAEDLLRRFPKNSDTFLLGCLTEEFPDAAMSDIVSALWAAKKRD